VGNVLGNNGNWAYRGPVRKATSGSAVAYETPYCIALGKWSEAGSYTMSLANPATTFIDHGNWDSVTKAVAWDAGITDHNIPVSYAYAAKPAWWPAAVAWPPIDAQNVPANLDAITNPAKYRYENGST
jgi:hypothetical protein